MLEQQATFNKTVFIIKSQVQHSSGENQFWHTGPLAQSQSGEEHLGVSDCLVHMRQLRDCPRRANGSSGHTRRSGNCLLHVLCGNESHLLRNWERLSPRGLWENWEASQENYFIPSIIQLLVKNTGAKTLPQAYCVGITKGVSFSNTL